jgi:NAD(P)H-hydrate epimerase
LLEKIVDAVFGTGFQGEITGDLAELFHNISATTNRILAVDIPSGIDGLTGDVCGVAVRATKTVTMQCIKKGLLDNDGPRYAGEVIVADIGIPTE